MSRFGMVRGAFLVVAVLAGLLGCRDDVSGTGEELDRSITGKTDKMDHSSCTALGNRILTCRFNVSAVDLISEAMTPVRTGAECFMNDTLPDGDPISLQQAQQCCDLGDYDFCPAVAWPDPRSCMNLNRDIEKCLKAGHSFQACATAGDNNPEDLEACCSKISGNLLVMCQIQNETIEGATCDQIQEVVADCARYDVAPEECVVDDLSSNDEQISVTDAMQCCRDYPGYPGYKFCTLSTSGEALWCGLVEEEVTLCLNDGAEVGECFESLSEDDWSSYNNNCCTRYQGMLEYCAIAAELM